jgi:hypothetical protein
MLIRLEEAMGKKLNDQDSPCRTCEAVRIVGSREVARWIEVGRTHPFGFKNQRGPLIVVRSSVGSVLELGVRKFGGWTKLFGCVNRRVAKRSEPLDPGMGELLDQNSTGIRV